MKKMRFEVYTKDVEIQGETYKLKPLRGRHLPMLFSALKGFKAKEGEELNISDIDEEAMGKLHTLALETFKLSYPDEDEEKLDRFVTQNLMVLFKTIIELNIGNNGEN
jgi:hypothetical protein